MTELKLMSAQEVQEALQLDQVYVKRETLRKRFHLDPAFSHGSAHFYHAEDVERAKVIRQRELTQELQRHQRELRRTVPADNGNKGRPDNLTPMVTMATISADLRALKAAFEEAVVVGPEWQEAVTTKLSELGDDMRAVKELLSDILEALPPTQPAAAPNQLPFGKLPAPTHGKPPASSR